MKKSLSTVLLLLCCDCLSAQTTIAPRAGLTLASIATTNDQPGFAPGLLVGIGLDVPLNDKFSVHPELTFVQRGYRDKYSESYSGDTETIESTLVLNYFEIPALLRFKFGGGKLQGFLNGGVALGIGISGKYKTKYDYSGSGGSYSSSGSIDIKFGKADNEFEEGTSIPNRFDVGVQIGGGVIIAKKIIVDMRFSRGLTNLEKTLTTKHRVFQFSVASPFALRSGKNKKS
jgi:hypothetical protein